MYSKTILLLTLFLPVALPLSAQVSLERQVIGSLGQMSSSSSIQLSATAGESLVTTLVDNNVILLQGFQQPEPEDLTTTEYVSELLDDLSVYPNPANGNFWVKVTTQHTLISMSLRAVDITGRTVLELPHVRLATGQQALPVAADNWPSGLYLIRLRSSSGQLLGSTKLMIQ